jgi:hypothetical protein
VNDGGPMLNITTHDRFHASSKEKYSSPKILIISSKKVFIQIRKKNKNIISSAQHALDTNLEVMGQMIGAPTGQE